ncbi:MAG TPA: MFS transporter, partial [Pseudolysinimonas sp.]
MTDARPRRRLPRAARPFLHGQYRILALALVMSLLGGGVWLVSMVFEIKDTLGGGPIAVSYVATANALGLIVATLIGGAIADRIPQKRILVTIEGLKVVVAGTTAVLAITGNIEL